MIVLLGLVAAVGWLVWDRQKSDSSNNQATQTNVSQNKQQAGNAFKPEIPAGWEEKSAEGVEFAVPAGWQQGVEVEKFAADENIPVGYGAPVWVRYSTSAQAWQTIDMDNSGNPSIVRDSNLVKNSESKVEGVHPTATYVTGDGGDGQYRVLVLKNNQVYQLSLPALCGDTVCEGDKEWTVQKIESSLPAFIKTIVIN